MITEKQKQKVIELSQQGNSQTQIAKQLKISRTKILEIVKENKIKNNKVLPGQEFESDPDIIKLKKEAIKEELKRKIRISKEPFETEEELEEMQAQIEILQSRLGKMLVATDTYECGKCGTKGKVCITLRCSKCEHETWWGWQV
ncbi:hypothetical protein ES703_53048 [subsurface metagenome]